MSKKKIAIIDHVGSKAGMDYYTGLLAGGMKHNGVEVVIISNFTVPGIKSYTYFIGHTGNNIRKGLNHLLAFVRAAVACRRNAIREVVVHLFSYELKDVYALRVLRMAGLHVTAIVHDVESFASADSKQIRETILLKLAERLVVHNRFSYDALKDAFGPAVAAKTKIIPHGNFHQLPDKNISHTAARAHLGWKENITYLLFFGQIKEVKGLEILLRAMPMLPEYVTLVIAGKPWKNDFTAYQQLIDKLNIGERIISHVRFIEDTERDLLFHAADLLALPYKQIFQSGVLLMAMSYKLPVVASNLAPMKELVTDKKTGFLFETENEISLAAAIKDALDNPALLYETAERAWEQTKENNDWDKIARAITDWENGTGS